ncbi:acyl-CoA thioesterase [Pengzhenrongella frigida]|uniref:Acyl-CoA thioesterase n=1 Tax=Pengzhenrongella frigida TaxID=1259133 RepID=A0A4Q5N2U3_9MICO|nr:thioesterase family protein [Cellulomonas sp. HLT2-17]RYV52406.1 acyl-CoA thioesterase [Cellulomonas sp. HLT2-17]
MSRLRVPVQLRWSDMDAYGHINNVEMFRVLEEARIAAFWAHPHPGDDGGWPTAVIDAGPGSQTVMLVARQEIEYLRPLGYRRAPIIVELWIGHLGGASVEVCYEVHDGEGGTEEHDLPATDVPEGEPPIVYARAATTLVLVDPATGSPRRLTDAERASWSPYFGDAVKLRRRGSTT